MRVGNPSLYFFIPFMAMLITGPPAGGKLIVLNSFPVIFNFAIAN